MPSHKNRAIIAAAGSRKTQFIVEQALANPNRGVLITTYTNENLKQLALRLSHGSGVIPRHITLTGWFSFLISECARPYQRSVIGQPNLIRSLNFDGSRSLYTPRAEPERFFLDENHDIYRNGLSHFVCEVEKLTEGRVIGRLGKIFDHIYIDEIQDMVGYDLEFLDSLMDSSLPLTVVGDPRQHTYSTNTSGKNKKFQGAGLLEWLVARKSKCDVVERRESFRCNQAICDFADALYPKLPTTKSRNTEATGHDGIFQVPRSQVLEYVREHNPVVLRNNKRADTLGLPAINFGQSKGSTYERVLIFPTDPIRKYLSTRDLSKVDSKDRLYVAVTRARHSVAFVVPG